MPFHGKLPGLGCDWPQDRFMHACTSIKGADGILNKLHPNGIEFDPLPNRGNVIDIIQKINGEVQTNIIMYY
jgi:hypothetical protein